MSTTNGITAPITTPARADRRRPGWAARARTKIADSTLIQAALAGALSFTHIRDVALRYHQDGWKSWVYPLSVDLLTVAAYRVIKRNKADGEPAGVAWTCFIMGLAASLAANIADAVAGAPARAGRADLTASIIIGMWPAAAFLASTLLGHGSKITDRPSVDPATDRHAPANRSERPAERPTAPIVRPATDRRPADQPTPIPVQPTGHLGDLGPRAAITGELPMTVWTVIGHPLYLRIKSKTGRRPAAAELQQALAERTAELIDAGQLPAAVGEPSVSTAKRIRTAIEAAHPSLAPRLTAVPA